MTIFDFKEFREDAFRFMEVQICGETRTVQFACADHGGDNPTMLSVSISWDDALKLSQWISATVEGK